MTDISKCNGENCPIKETCWRYLAPDGHWQSYMNYEYNKEKNKCDGYWKVESKSQMKRFKVQTSP